jgi:hypothetical protein
MKERKYKVKVYKTQIDGLLDMLRYDRAIISDIKRIDADNIEVEFILAIKWQKAPTFDRWLSFGLKVEGVDLK